ncbi:AAA family ATPase [Arthrobacter sp. LAPM80]|uniref:AAA family ATPase n=1 Tax=Arthrobacter sp. LAPM80 TaxID=3141788 RepID=UPI00398A87AC
MREIQIPQVGLVLRVGNDMTDQSVTPAAFEALNFVATKHLEAGLLTVVDATNVQPSARQSLVDVARSQDVLVSAIVLNVPLELCPERNEERGTRDVAPTVIARQHRQLSKSLRGMRREGFLRVHVLSSQEEVDDATIRRHNLLNDFRDEHGPFDLIGDVHGCLDELLLLLEELGYTVASDEAGPATDAIHPESRRVIFVGDLVDRGPDSAGVLRLAMGMVGNRHALCVPGNHEEKLVRALRGRKVALTHELDALVLDDGNLVIAHAGLIQQYHGRASKRVRAFALYGQVSGEIDEYGLPVRHPWANEYRGDAMVLYGHTPVTEVAWINKTACLDTGCVFGGALSAMRCPEREVIQVKALKKYCEPGRPLESPRGPERKPGVLSMEDVTGPLHLRSEGLGTVRISETQAAGALEAMSRYAIDPRWLCYLPPTMSPAESSSQAGYLEHPDEAFGYFRRQGVTQLICEEKHMGSRAVMLLSQNPGRFDAPEGWLGALHTRAGLWDEMGSDWLILDGELMPWSLKAEPLIKDTYASVGAAAIAATDAAVAILESTTRTGIDVHDLLSRTRARNSNAKAFRESYRRYVGSAEDLRVAAFQVMAAEGQSFETRNHGWHLEISDRLAAVRWWEEATATGSEGMVVKPWQNLTKSKRGWVQPGIKVRGREYLRLIYGPDYLEEANLERLRQRATDKKRNRALQEYILGLEALRLTSAGAPLWKIHQMVFGVLALESEPLDPRL